MPTTVYFDAQSSVRVIDDAPELRYELFVGDEPAGFMTYRTRGSRRVLLHTVVSEAFRGRGLSKVLIRGILDSLRASGNSITIHCSAIEKFLRDNPQYASLVDAEHPGIWSGGRG